MKLWNVLGVVLVLAIAAGGGTWWYVNSHDTKPVYATATATRGDISVKVTGSGNLALSNTANVTFPVQSQVLAVLVDVGQTVTKGQMVVSLDPSYFQGKISSLQLTALQAQKSLIQTQVTLQNDQANLIKIQTPYSASDIALALANYQIAANSVATDQANLAAAITANNQQDIQKWTLQLNKDQITANNLNTTYTNEVNATPDPNQLSLAQLTIQIDQLAVDNAQAALTTAQAAVTSAGTPPAGLYAPFTGIITSINAQAGNTYNTNGVALGMANTAILTDTIQVSEANIFKIKSGMDASVTISSTGSSYPAKITFISSSATTSQGVVSYRVTVTLTQNSSTDVSQLKAGLTANVSIVTAKSTNAVLVPNSAITTVNGVSSVQILGSDGKVTTQTITTGLSDYQNTEVTSGLTEGQVIILSQGPAATAKVTSTTSGNILQPTQTSGTIVTVPIGPGGGGGFVPPTR
jgi:RND family efflux transporter MFP subunit